MSIKKIAFAAASSAVMFGSLAIPVLAVGPVSDSASAMACFGQARGAYAMGGPNGVLSPLSNGSYISERKGTNPVVNAAYIAEFCNL